jgi:hypothetical protein
MILITARMLVKKKVLRGLTLQCVHARGVTDADPPVHPAWCPHVDLPLSVCRLPNNPWSVVQISNLCYHPSADAVRLVALVHVRRPCGEGVVQFIREVMVMMRRDAGSQLRHGSYAPRRLKKACDAPRRGREAREEVG